MKVQVILIGTDCYTIQYTNVQYTQQTIHPTVSDFHHYSFVSIEKRVVIKYTNKNIVHIYCTYIYTYRQSLVIINCYYR